jgi:N-acetylglucosamine-6-phosphate deacetylase
MDEFTVTIDKQGFCKSETGRLMGSTKSVLYGVFCFGQSTASAFGKVLPMSSLMQQISMVWNTKRVDRAWKDADLVVIDGEYKTIATYVEGRIVYDSRIEKEFFNQII